MQCVRLFDGRRGTQVATLRTPPNGLRSEFGSRLGRAKRSRMSPPASANGGPASSANGGSIADAGAGARVDEGRADDFDAEAGACEMAFVDPNDALLAVTASGGRVRTESRLDWLGSPASTLARRGSAMQRAVRLVLPTVVLHPSSCAQVAVFDLTKARLLHQETLHPCYTRLPQATIHPFASCLDASPPDGRVLVSAGVADSHVCMGASHGHGRSCDLLTFPPRNIHPLRFLLLFNIAIHWHCTWDADAPYVILVHRNADLRARSTARLSCWTWFNSSAT